LADVIDPRGPIFLGLLLHAVAMYYLGLISPEATTVWLTLLVVLYRMSFGCVYTPVTSIVLKALPNDRLSMGSGLDGVHRGLASAFGIALGSTILEYRTMIHLVGLGEGQEVSTLAVRETAATIAQFLGHAGELGGTTGGETLAILRQQLFQQAQMAAYQDTFLLLSVVTLLALVPAMLSQVARKSSTMQSK
jgi:MFS transporter, DHA2 family, multidrug resistance protein